MGQETISAKFGRYSKSGHEDASKGASEHHSTSSHAPVQRRPWDLKHMLYRSVLHWLLIISVIAVDRQFIGSCCVDNNSAEA